MSPSPGTFHQLPQFFSAGLLLFDFSEARRLNARLAIHHTQLFAACGSVNCETHAVRIFVEGCVEYCMSFPKQLAVWFP